MLIKILLAASLLNISHSTLHYVISEKHQYNHGNNYTATLQHYLDNSERYFISHHQLYFLQGEHHLNTDLVLKNINNFTITGMNFTIICTSSASIAAVNVTNLKLKNIYLNGCGKNQSAYFNSTHFSSEYKKNPKLLNKVGFNSSVLLYYCSSVIASYINITVNAGNIGLLAMNARNISTLSYVSIKVNLLCSAFQSQITGILVYYSAQNKNHNLDSKPYYFNIVHYHYEIIKLCSNSNYLQHTITILLFERQYYSVEISVQNTMFTKLNDSRVLFFYEELTNPASQTAFIRSTLIIDTCTISKNRANNSYKMFHIVYYTGTRTIELYIRVVYSKVHFKNCIFESNNNMEAIILIKPSISRKLITFITFHNVTLQNNRDVIFLKVYSGGTAWQTTVFITMHNINISLNQHQNNDSLMLFSNSVIKLFGLFFTNNSFFDNLIKLDLSTALFRGYNELTGNCVRQILYASTTSYLFIRPNAILNISNNIVYIVVKQRNTYNNNNQRICLFQLAINTNQDKDMHVEKLDYKIVMLNNELMISKSLQGQDMSFGNCTWLDGTAAALQTIKPNVIFSKILMTNYTIVNSTSVRIISLSVCVCSSINNHSNCYSPNLGSVFPGQILNTQLTLSRQYLNEVLPSTTLVVANTPNDECSILNSQQLSQTHLNQGCNNYSYNIWPSNNHITECKLFLGLKDMPEMFYIQIKPCPKGFKLSDTRKACYCDPLLNTNFVSITSCNLDDETILRPANSWISADTLNKSHTYLISSSCPFYYCLQDSSHLNLSDPDSQCQFSRSGRLCGQCQKGLSAVIGSLQCKKCSNIYLLIIIPIAIAGIVLVLILFISNITVTSGIINDFIFYANIININYSMFCSNSHSIDCAILSLINLDLGIETCFYNGMTDFTKVLLQLAFPAYLILIAATLIIGSRHSMIMQRFTARRGTQVLATLFLIVYTKVLLSVCQILFFFSQITYIPSNKTIMVWSIDTSASLSGIKFCSIFVVCIILFLILLTFNVILLFPRTLSRIKFISTYKPLFDAYFAPYKDIYPFWTGLQLLVRALFFALSAVRSDFSFTGAIAILGIQHCIHGIFHPFRNKFNNIKESLILLNLVTLYVVVIVLNDDDDRIRKTFIVKILINIVLTSFFISIFAHCIVLKYGNIIKNICHSIAKQLKSMLGQTQSLEIKTFSSEIPDAAYNYQEFQEPLIAVDD